ncbi:MAG: HDOD domain-containing protein [Fibrobacterota bacterium]|nr:HDOD domain-containing protein [Fibrobacterota bacterium]QQS04803.1 MAG: HDOD domain-containing protein [Fibrobacterota bacterium]
MSPAIAQEQPPSPMDEWVRRLCEEEMPVFAQTIGEINKILGKEEYSSLALARVVLQDPSMTAKVLKLANSAFYNPGGTSISTISRAVVVLGFNAVQAICVTIAVIESLVKGKAKDRVMRELARSIHAASQARNIANIQRDQSSEEIFIAALLMNLGQMAFWCFAGVEGERLDKALTNSPQRDPHEVEREVLGFRLSSLTTALAEEWKLTGLVQEGLKGAASKDARGKLINLGHQIAIESEGGWASPNMKKLAAEVGKITGKATGEVGPMMESCACEAVTTARTMGAGTAARLIPVPSKNADVESSWEVGEVTSWANPDPMLQLKILRDITTTMMSKPDLGMILEMVLEGIHRGAGMDRTVLALVTPGRAMVKAKHVLAPDRLRLLDRFWFELGKPPKTLFTNIMEGAEAMWVSDYQDPLLAPLLIGSIPDVIERAKFFVGPVCYSGQTIGLFYADRHASGRELDIDAFETFKLFVHQANLGLDHVARLRVAAVAAAAAAPKPR